MKFWGKKQTKADSYAQLLSSLYAVAVADGNADAFLTGISLFQAKEGVAPKNFWERSFGNVTEVPWEEFLTAFISEYTDKIDKNFTWLCDVVKTDVFQNEPPTLARFKSFRGEGEDPNLFWKKLLKHTEGKDAPAFNFWERTFPKRKDIKFMEFLDAFLTEYKEKIDELFPEQATWVLDLCKSGVFLNEDPTLARFLIFRGTGPDPNEFFKKLSEVADRNAILKPIPNFWARQWPERLQVTWSEFLEAFLKEYGDVMNSMYKGQKTWVCDVIRHQCFKGIDPTLVNFLIFRGTEPDPNEFMREIQIYLAAHNWTMPKPNFWGRHWGEELSVSFEDFDSEFRKEYGESLVKKHFSGKEDEISKLMKEKVFGGGDATFHKFIVFRGTSLDPDQFSKALISLAKENGLK